MVQRRTTLKISEGVKDWVRFVLFFTMLGSVVALGVVPAYQQTKFSAHFHTHYNQAFQAATPREFADALWRLDNALEEFGMVQGDTVVGPSRAQNDMAFKRVRFRELAARADALAKPGVAPTEVSTGLTDMRQILANVRLSVYGFWLWSQGGVWVSVYIPLIVFSIAFMLFLATWKVPDEVRNPFASPPQPA